MSITVRSYGADDRQACRALWVELTQQHREIYEDPAIGGDDPGSYFDVHLAHPKLAGMWVAQVEGRIVGMIGLLAGGEEGEIEPLVIARGWQSQGIGRMLLEHVRHEARRRGVRFLCVRPVARNVTALRFFVEAGFATVGQVELFQDLDSDSRRQWQNGITLHGMDLQY